MTDAAPPTVLCGTVRTVGGEARSWAVLDTGDGAVTLGGPRGAHLIGYGGRVCVVYTERSRLPMYGDTVTVTSYRLSGDGKHAPIAGVVHRRGATYVLETDDHKRFVLRGTDLERLAGRRVYVDATWRDGALDVRSFGFLGP